MDSIPLTYDSLRTVLQNTEANRRFLLSAHIPTIRSVEKSVPLEIETVDFQETYTSVNHKKYEVTVRRENDEGVWDSFQKKHTFFESLKDVDKHGMDEDFEERVLPGDVVFERAAPRTEPARDMARTIGNLEYEIKKNSRILNEIRSIFPHIDINALAEEEIIKENQGSGHFDNFIYGMFDIVEKDTVDASDSKMDEEDLLCYSPTYTLEELRHPDVEKEMKEAVKYLWNQIRTHRYKLKHWCAVRDKVEQEFELQLNITGEPENGNHIERVKYNKKIHEAFKSINNFIFGGRRNTVYVKELTVHQNDVIRAPIGLKMKIQQMHVLGSVAAVYEPLQLIVDESSYPLEKLMIYANEAAREDYNHYVTISAHHLFLYPDFRDPLVPILGILPNRKVWTMLTYQLHANHYVELIRIWMREGRDIGTCFTFSQRDESDMVKTMELIKDEFQGAGDARSVITIPMSDASELKIFSKPTNINHIRGDKYVMYFEVQAVE